MKSSIRTRVFVFAVTAIMVDVAIEHGAHSVASAARSTPRATPSTGRSLSTPARSLDAGTISDVVVVGSAPVVDRTALAVEAIHRSGAVAACWNALLRAEPEMGQVQLRLRVSFGADGSLTQALATQPAPTALIQCAARDLRSVRIPAGPSVTVNTAYNFMPGQFVPVPATSADAGR